MDKKNSQFQIRKASEEDVPAILGLVKELSVYERLSHKVFATEKLFKEYGFGENPYFHALIVDYFENGKKFPVGFALYLFTFSTFEGKPTLYLEDLFVKPEYRGMGMGKQFLTHLANIALEKGCARMEWAVLDWNEPAIKFYKSIGATAMSDWTVYRLENKEIIELAHGKVK
jgi:GNAT superfamily N-acetyltransferase